MKLKNLMTIALMSVPFAGINAQHAARFDMSLADGNIKEAVSGSAFSVISQLPATTISGLDGEALRFDGYSNYVKGSLNTSSFSTSTLTVNVVLAVESYPMMQVDVAETTPTFATICGNLDETGKKGFAFELSSQGDIQFRYGSASNFILRVAGSKKLPRGKWSRLTAVLDKNENAARIYLNGEEIGTGRMSSRDMVHSTTEFYIGKNSTDVRFGQFLINTFCGAIDEITVDNAAVAPEAFSPSRADFNYPSSRYAESLWRPQFHGMPSGSWTNESHGMTFSNGRYHVFFQKNANGPYMSRLHWGHISSANLYDWKEEPIAIAPGESYDMKGCWSGCVYEDGGKTNILYTAVDNAKARIVHATAQSADLVEWNKQGVVIDGRPAGLSDDFRDPYSFTANGQRYIIVGTSKDGIGACTLHKYVNGSWTNDGSIFFRGSSKATVGRFWEMPTVTDMGNGKWLFTCTPLETSAGVRTLYSIGMIDSEGRFQPFIPSVSYLEMGGISKDGYGLLSPTIFQKDGKTLLMGIVPDKLATEENFKMGWAHNYSLPREISIDANGNLVQKPYSGLTDMRTATAYSKELALTGTESLSPVSGRQVELLGEFKVNGKCGFNFLKSGSQQASLTYDPAVGTLTLDLTALSRVVNDNAYGGVYSATLPSKVNIGETLKLHVFLDGSIADIFVNDTWAFSVRIFPKDANAVEAEAFAENSTQATLKAWKLDATSTGIDMPYNGQAASHTEDSRVYNIAGQRVGNDYKGIVISNKRKYVAR